MQTKEAKGAEGARRQRVPVTGKQPLAVRGKEPGYVYRIVNDVDDRVLQLQEAGYEVVRGGGTSVGDKRVDKGTDAENFSVGGGIRAVLMRQREDWYNDDQEAKQATIVQLEESTRKDALNGHYGNLNIERK